MVQASLRSASLSEAHHDPDDIVAAQRGSTKGNLQFGSPAGNMTSTFAPPEIPSEIAILPPFRSTNFFANGKPIPVPSGLVVKNGSKTRSLLSTGIPSPVSSMEMLMLTSLPLPLQTFVRIVTRPPLGVASS